MNINILSVAGNDHATLNINTAGGHCTYNVILRGVSAHIFAVKKQWVLREMCICSLRYPVWKAHAPYFHLCPAPLYSIFPLYLVNGIIFGGGGILGGILNTKCVFWFSLQLLSETFFILKRNEWAIVKHVYRTSCKTVFLNRRAAARYRALASIILGRERFSSNLSF